MRLAFCGLRFVGSQVCPVVAESLGWREGHVLWCEYVLLPSRPSIAPMTIEVRARQPYTAFWPKHLGGGSMRETNLGQGTSVHTDSGLSIRA